MDARADLSGETVLGAKEARRVWDSRCLVTGDGLLGAADETRRSFVGTKDFFRAIGLVVRTGCEVVALDTLRLEGRVLGDGD
jgi:predicted RNA polymerase sigma factor